MFSNLRHRVVEWGDCDPACIVFNPRYFEWFDAGTAALFVRALGLSAAAMNQKYDIVGIPLVDTRATFHIPCSYGDEISIESTLLSFGRSSFQVRHRLLRPDGKLSVEGLETRVWVGRHPDRPGAIKAQPIPAEVIACFSLAPVEAG
jgi:4-hydroxybenzoyl-CoA thioesterase